MEWTCRKYFFYNWTEFILQVPFKWVVDIKSQSLRVFLHQEWGWGGSGEFMWCRGVAGSWPWSMLLAPTKIPLHNVVPDHWLTRVTTSPLCNLHACLSPSALLHSPLRSEGNHSPTPRDALGREATTVTVLLLWRHIESRDKSGVSTLT